MKGVLLAGGTGSRLWPITKGVSKQLLPIYDKPMIYYPLSTLMLAGVREILVIVAPGTEPQFRDVLRDGSQLGLSLSYQVQERPDGLAHALLMAEEFSAGSRVAMALGDNLLYGPGMGQSLEAMKDSNGAVVFAVPVQNPHDYGVVEFDSTGRPVSIVEKPTNPKSNLAVPGLYFYDRGVSDLARTLKRSARGEYEISDLNQLYLDRGELEVKVLPRGTTWLDTGTVEAFADAVDFVRVIEKRQGVRIGCPEEIAWRMGYISPADLVELAKPMMKSGYGEYLLGLLEQD